MSTARRRTYSSTTSEPLDTVRVQYYVPSSTSSIKIGYVGEGHILYYKIVKTGEEFRYSNNDKGIYYPSGKFYAGEIMDVDILLDKESTNFSYLFEYSELYSIPENLFEGCEAIRTVSYCFSGTQYLTEIPDTMYFFSFSNCTDFEGCFKDSGISKIPTELLKMPWLNEQERLNVSKMFSGTKITEIPEEIFYYHTLDSDVSECFSNCTNLTNIPRQLFNYSGQTGDYIKKLDGCFEGCTSLTLISDFILPQNITSVSRMFKNCENLTEIPGNLFQDKNYIKDFSSCFEGCKKINFNSNSTSAFYGCYSAENFSRCFYGCSSLKIPLMYSSIFRDCTAVTDFSYCFANTGTTHLVDASMIFNPCTKVTTFQGCFQGCANLTTVPETLFNENRLVENFSYCFADCPKLASIGEYFTNTTKVKDFACLFKNDTSLRTIPESIFHNTPEVTSFIGCFQGCTELTDIPITLFQVTTKVIDFSNCFRECTLISKIPEYLFAYCTVTEKFKGCFYKCTNITSSCPKDSDQTPIYNRSTPKPGYVTVLYGNGAECFYDCTSMSDYNEIPYAWKR